MTYPITTVVRARELRDAGWTLRRVCDFVERETGRRPSLNTVAYWTNADFEQRKLKRGRERHREFSAVGAGGGGRLGARHHTPEFKLARARALRAAGLSLEDVARVMSFDFGEPVSRAQMDRALSLGRWPRTRAECPVCLRAGCDTEHRECSPSRRAA